MNYKVKNGLDETDREALSRDFTAEQVEEIIKSDALITNDHGEILDWGTDEKIGLFNEEVEKQKGYYDKNGHYVSYVPEPEVIVEFASWDDSL